MISLRFKKPSDKLDLRKIFTEHEILHSELTFLSEGAIMSECEVQIVRRVCTQMLSTDNRPLIKICGTEYIREFNTDYIDSIIRADEKERLVIEESTETSVCCDEMKRIVLISREVLKDKGIEIPSN